MNQQTNQPAARSDVVHGSEATPGLVALSHAIDYSLGSPASRDSQAALAHGAGQQGAPSSDSAHALAVPMDPTWHAISSAAGNHPDGLNITASGGLGLSGPVFDGRRGDDDFQGASPNFQTPPWQTSADFELEAFHRSIIDSSLVWPVEDLGQPQLEQLDLPSSPPQNASPPRQDSVQQHWFTHLPPHRPEDAMQDALGERSKVDEAYRASLSQRLLLRVPHEPLPSADFLVLPPQPLVHSLRDS